MKAKIATWLISLAMVVNGGPIEPVEETETLSPKPTTIVETVEIENIEVENIEIETKEIEVKEIEIEEAEAEPLSIEPTKFEAAEETVKAIGNKISETAITTWDQVETTWDSMISRMWE